jgi:TPP-dependent pyruvate/acetoin dehydrogenase alpha subunit
MPKKRSRRTPTVAGEPGASPAPAVQPASEIECNSQPDTLRRLYAGLLCWRRVQERLQSDQAGDDIRLGSEAITVGATAELTAGDSLTAPPLNLRALLATRAAVSGLFGENPIGSARLGVCNPFVPGDPVNAGVGLALAHHLERKRGVVVAFCEPPRSLLEPWSEALNFAQSHKLPIIFVIESADAFSLSQPPPYLAPLSYMVCGDSFPGIVVDGSDVVAVWRVVQESVHRARNGLGPTLVECRPDAARDPLGHMIHYLRQRKAWDESWNQQITREIAGHIEQALATTVPATATSQTSS